MDMAIVMVAGSLVRRSLKLKAQQSRKLLSELIDRVEVVHLM